MSGVRVTNPSTSDPRMTKALQRLADTINSAIGAINSGMAEVTRVASVLQAEHDERLLVANGEISFLNGQLELMQGEEESQPSTEEVLPQDPMEELKIMAARSWELINSMFSGGRATGNDKKEHDK